MGASKREDLSAAQAAMKEAFEGVKLAAKLEDVMAILFAELVRQREDADAQEQRLGGVEQGHRGAADLMEVVRKEAQELVDRALATWRLGPQIEAVHAAWLQSEQQGGWVTKERIIIGEEISQKALTEATPRLDHDADSLHKALVECRGEVAAASAAAAASANAAAAAADAMGELRAGMARAEAAAAAAGEAVERVGQQLTAEVSRLEAATGEAVKEARGAAQRMSAERVEERRRVDEAQDEAAALRTRLTVLEAQLEGVRRELVERVEVGLADAAAEATKASEVSRLQERLEVLEKWTAKELDRLARARAGEAKHYSDVPGSAATATCLLCSAAPRVLQDEAAKSGSDGQLYHYTHDAEGDAQPRQYVFGLTPNGCEKVWEAPKAEWEFSHSRIPLRKGGGFMTSALHFKDRGACSSPSLLSSCARGAPSAAHSARRPRSAAHRVRVSPNG